MDGTPLGRCRSNVALTHGPHTCPSVAFQLIDVVKFPVLGLGEDQYRIVVHGSTSFLRMRWRVISAGLVHPYLNTAMFVLWQLTILHFITREEVMCPGLVSDTVTLYDGNIILQMRRWHRLRYTHDLASIRRASTFSKTVIVNLERHPVALVFFPSKKCYRSIQHWNRRWRDRRIRHPGAKP